MNLCRGFNNVFHGDGDLIGECYESTFKNKI